MSLRPIPGLLLSQPGFSFLSEVVDSGGALTLAQGAFAPTIAGIVEHKGHSAVVVVVCATGRESDALRDELRSLVPKDTVVLDFPAWETLPHERLSPHPETVARRLSALRALAHGERTHPLVVVAPIRALVQSINPSNIHH